MRCALYWVPARHDPLYRAGVTWLGRDAETGARVAQPAFPGIADVTRDAGRYGVHATLQPPMRLATRYEAFRASVHAVAAGSAPFDLPPLIVCEIDGFLALRESVPCQPLQALADRCVMQSLAHRAAPDAAEFARRRAAGLTPRQEALLQRYFYPYVREEWFFHITLSCRLKPARLRQVRDAAEAHFRGVLKLPRRVRDICICTQGSDEFLIAERVVFGKEESASF